MTSMNPILFRTELPRFRLTSPIRPPREGTALVLTSKSGPALVVRPGQKVPDARIGAHQWAVVVDMAAYALGFDAALPSNDPGHPFHASVAFTCRVTDPVWVATHNVQDMTAVLRRPLESILRTVSYRYDVMDLFAAETEMGRYLRSAEHSPVARVDNLSVHLINGASELHRLNGEIRRDDVRRAAARRVVDGGREELLANAMARNGGDPTAFLEFEESIRQREEISRIEVLKTLVAASDRLDSDTTGTAKRVAQQFFPELADQNSGTADRRRIRPRIEEKRAGTADPGSAGEEAVDGDAADQGGNRVRHPRQAAPGPDGPRVSRVRGTAWNRND